MQRRHKGAARHCQWQEQKGALQLEPRGSQEQGSQKKQSSNLGTRISLAWIPTRCGWSSTPGDRGGSSSKHEQLLHFKVHMRGGQ